MVTVSTTVEVTGGSVTVSVTVPQIVVVEVGSLVNGMVGIIRGSVSSREEHAEDTERTEHDISDYELCMVNKIL